MYQKYPYLVPNLHPQVFLCLLAGLFDRFRNFACFTKTHADATFFVASNNDRRKAKASTALDHFRAPVDVHDSIFEF
jgi:hypothetical protein